MGRKLDQRRRRKPGPGLRQEFPQRESDRLRRYIAGIDTVLRRSTEKHLIPALDRGTDRAALRRMQRDVDQEYSDENIEKELTAIAAAVNTRHSALFYASIGAALGVVARPIAKKAQPPPKGATVVIVEQFGELGVKGFIRDGTKLIKSVRATAIPRIRREIETARALNQDPTKLAKRWAQKGLPLKFGTVEGRAKVIARDQLGKLQGNLTELRQTNAGIKSYIWRTQMDDRVRDEHADREGVEFRWDSAPDDGHPGEPINCFPGDMRIQAAGVEALYRRWYEGDLIVLQGDSWTLRCTPNHPILTRKGWRAAKQLQRGDDVLKLGGGTGGVGDHHDNQPSIDEVWDLAERVAPCSAARGRFHGDASPHEEIDVVRINRDLFGDEMTAGSQGLGDVLLAIANDRPLSLGPMDEFGMGSLDASDRIMGSSSSGPTILGGHPGVHGEHGVGAPSGLDINLPEPTGEHGAADRNLSRKDLHGFPSKVAFDQIREVGRRVGFCGHVYNLQTASGIYIASTIAVHNCRCFAEAVVRPEDLIASPNVIELEAEVRVA